MFQKVRAVELNNCSIDPESIQKDNINISMNLPLRRVWESFLRPLKLAMLFLVFPAVQLLSQGKVYLVLGSDTAIWDNMDVARYSPHYNPSLYTAPSDNAYAVMDPAFRNNLVDSYGQTLKMTWWMMAGNIFRYADNTDVPLPNIMTLYLMKKYHGAAIQQWGDELSLHYHTFAWTDYDKDGKYYWNQAHSFDECRDDFKTTLAQFLLEENVFPVSFRSGWHYMDNTWQAYLDTLLPYCLHDDYPNVRRDTVEPIDNVYDWSRSSAVFVPFHPSTSDYQVPGNGKGWNVRSIHMGNVGQSLMDNIFASAAAGTDQVACLWAHLPETDFLDNIRKIDSLAHASASKYPAVQFRYCTAVEAMQRWRGVYGELAPQVTFQEVDNAGYATFTVSVDKPIFQAYPVVAVKDIYERYQLMPMERVSANSWKTSVSVPLSDFAKAGVAVTDTAGNLATQIIEHLPDDAYIDNSDPQYEEEKGSWLSATETGCWGTDARTVLLGANDTVKAHWLLPVTQDGRYNIFVRLAPNTNPAGNVTYEVFSNNTRVDSTCFSDPMPAKEWIFVGSEILSHLSTNYLLMSVIGNGQAGKYASADVVKLSALVPVRALALSSTQIDFGTVSQYDTATANYLISNHGSGPLSIQSIASASGRVLCAPSGPLTLPSMQSLSLTLEFGAEDLGTLEDTLIILSDDPVRPVCNVPCVGTVETYFVVRDNDDSLAYQEYGSWHYSNAEAYGSTSRYSNLSDGVGAYARFSGTLRQTGTYNIYEIVPTTVNAANKALYLVSENNAVKDSLYLDQNAGSGTWVLIGSYDFNAGSTVAVKIMNTGLSTSGAVLRADAIKFASVPQSSSVQTSDRAKLPKNFLLEQNYPNPFNPSTTIVFEVPAPSRIRLEVINILGQVVDALWEGDAVAGRHEVHWNASVPSGLYFCRLSASSVSQPGKRIQIVRKMLLIR